MILSELLWVLPVTGIYEVRTLSRNADRNAKRWHINARDVRRINLATWGEKRVNLVYPRKFINDKIPAFTIYLEPEEAPAKTDIADYAKSLLGQP
jgi:hypothetical protein